MNVMIKFFKSKVHAVLKRMNIGVIRYAKLENLYKNADATHDIEVLLTLNDGNAQLLLQQFTKSHSQIRQDLLVLSHLGFKRNG